MSSDIKYISSDRAAKREATDILDTRFRILSLTPLPQPLLPTYVWCHKSIFDSSSDEPPQSQAIQANGQIYVSGQIPADASGNLVEGSIADKTKACCEALKNILEDAGSGIHRTIKVAPHLFPA